MMFFYSYINEAYEFHIDIPSFRPFNGHPLKRNFTDIAPEIGIVGQSGILNFFLALKKSYNVRMSAFDVFKSCVEIRLHDMVHVRVSLIHSGLLNAVDSNVSPSNKIPNHSATTMKFFNFMLHSRNLLLCYKKYF